VPSGDYKNPTICDEKNLYAVSSLLQRVHIFVGDYRECAGYVDKDSLFILTLRTGRLMLHPVYIL